MTKRWVFLVLVVLTVVMTLGGALTAEAGKFSDLQEASWAQQDIAEMNALGIINGYPEGVFRPYQNVTMMEVVAVLIRALGLEEQAKSLENASVEYKMPPNLMWGRGYLIAAVQRGMLDKDNLYQFTPGSPATRLEVALLVYYALKLSPDSSSLTFTDADQIPQDYRDRVAAVANNNIMRGLPGNLFKPYDYHNRAQMAVLLSRLVNNGLVNPYPNRQLSGNISSVNLSGQTITIQPGGSKSFTSDCLFYLDGKSAAASDLRSGDEVKLILDKNNQVAYVIALRQNASLRYKGRVYSLYITGGEYRMVIEDFDGRSITYPVAGGVKVTRSGTVKDISSVETDEFVEIKVADGKVIEITFLETSTVRGTVSSTSSSSMTVRKSNGTKEKLDVPGNVVVEEDDSKKNYDDVEEDDLVKVEVYDGKVLKIEILSGSGLEGEIEDLDTSGAYGITIRDDDGDTYEYTVDEDVEVERDGSSIDFDELDEGERVVLEKDSDGRVVYIEVVDSSSSDLEGEIRNLDTTGTYGITIRKDNGKKVTYVVVSSVKVKRDGGTIDFDDLEKGERVRLELDSRDRVTYIRVIEDDESSISGIVTDLDTGGTPEIEIENDDGDVESYDISDDADFIKDGDDISLDDIVIGCEVEIELEDGEVARIEVTNDQDITVEGEVTYVSTSSKKIRIRQSSGSEFSYYLVSSPRLRDRSGNSIELGDVKVGWEVELELRGGKIYRLTRQ